MATYTVVAYFYQLGFDLTFTKESVGLVTQGLTVREAIKEGAAEYDFLRGDEPYKFLWASKVRGLAHFEVFPPGIQGAVRRSLAGAGTRIRRATRSLLGNSAAERIINRG